MCREARIYLENSTLQTTAVADASPIPSNSSFQRAISDTREKPHISTTRTKSPSSSSISVTYLSTKDRNTDLRLSPEDSLKNSPSSVGEYLIYCPPRHIVILVVVVGGMETVYYEIVVERMLGMVMAVEGTVEGLGLMAEMLAGTVILGGAVVRASVLGSEGEKEKEKGVVITAERKGLGHL
ncbi:hypothetical protein K469DRAFT_755407 [Zopfia rhizophila CBS 207.26]|uniref:Uncharacterized protein n=1 Tax=Zopfia rhizophila CBS 207.26 TaxID=1314779 RepID=A0A6A6DCP5_9PEZI|nr:hypothetical protein K469DRAFT_755407 [Zopfia rhizophila CBS 207.26]